ncbi:MAG TPA: hypothetical protein PKD72_07920 [Gemmatales bacterium]|nr:hypothetical protein [Gemmatales bacterium]
MIHIHLSSGLAEKAILREMIHRRLGFALSRFGEKVREVAVELFEEEALNGSADIRCKLIAHLEPHGVLSIEQSDTEPEMAIEFASIRLGRAIQRELERQRQSRSVTFP